ncbi:hypothetical protein AMELA_G00042140 [Ameiurus melas]|uniref:VWFC domain-containing protein n=1 Tax=Ameiurus melas TaxID=219545 RepID=A0A7J6B9Z5_AMEME|nr:hypothetical protein AMELA_G00042140 [Ameiurus melas]
MFLVSRARIPVINGKTAALCLMWPQLGENMELVMERRLLLSAVLSVCVLWRICSASQTDHHKELKVLQDTNVIDILEMLSITQSSQGIAKVKGHAPGTTAWRFHFHTPHLTFPLDVYQRFVRAWHGSLSLHLAGQQARGSVATLLSLSAPGNTPLLRIISNMREDFLQLEIHTTPNTKPEVLRFPGGNPFSGGRWARVVLGVAPGWVWMFQECKEATIVKLTHQGRPLTLNLPPHDLQVTLAKTAYDKVSQFNGYLQTAQISTTPYERRPWFCKNVTDPVPFPPAPYRSVDSEEELQDQPDCTGNSVLCPPAAPHDRAGNGEQRQAVRNLEERLHNITTMLLMLKQQNEDLQARVWLLESCECVRKTCVWENQEMKEGSRWRTDRHTECSCISGRVQCETSKKCGAGDVIHNVSYSTIDGCQTCSCRNGDMSCVDLQKCPRTCQDGVKPPFGSCCRDCSRCEYRGEVVREGVTFPDREDPCKVCVCSGGNVECNSVPCPTPDCSLVETVSGECCPRCEQCTYESEVFSDGQQFNSKENPCLSCRCSTGEVRCENIESSCSPVHCTNPTRQHGNCCPTCNNCVVHDREYRDGEKFVNPVNQCETCVCQGGQVECHNQCPRPTCNYPVTGTCCQNNCNAPPADCVYEGRLYRHTQRFYHPTDVCQLCSCTNGMVNCNHKPCPFASCTHPVQQECCRTCDGCLFKGVERANGEQFADVSDPCGVCRCHEGNVVCTSRQCPQVTCPFPVQGECCPSCGGTFHTPSVCPAENLRQMKESDLI